MLSLRFLERSWQTTAAAHGLYQHAPAEMINILPTSNKLSTVQILRYLSPSSSEPFCINDRCRVADAATFCARYTNGFALTTFTLKHRLSAYINDLDDEARGCLPHAEDVSRALGGGDVELEMIHDTDRCRHSPFAKGRPGEAPETVEECGNPWFLFVKSPYQNAHTGEDAVRLIKIRTCTLIKDCCWACRARNDLESSRRRQQEHTLSTALLDGSCETEKAKSHRILEMQREADAEALPSNNWLQKKTVHNNAKNSEQRPVSETRSCNTTNVCLSCKVKQLTCDGRKSTCTPCLAHGFKCTYRSKRGQGIQPEPRIFNQVRSKLNRMETPDIIETQYVVGEECAKHLPQWTKIARSAPTYFIRSHSHNEVFTPATSRRFVKLRQPQSTEPAFSRTVISGMPCLCEKCLANKWNKMRSEAEATPTKSALDPFHDQDEVGYERADKSRRSRKQAQQGSGFVKYSAGPSKLQEVS